MFRLISLLACVLTFALWRYFVRFARGVHMYPGMVTAEGRPRGVFSFL